MKFEPGYIKLNKTGELDKRIDKLYKILESCEICPRKCRINRLKGERGVCKSGKELIVSSYGPHFGEEPELVGRNGSGTIFLTNCNLLCIYCQNYGISHLGEGEPKTEEEVAGCMIELQNIYKCHNINLVTPTHFTPQLVKAIKLATEKGLKLPIVWNCGGYENVEIVKLLEGIVDIYMPDMKYGNENAKKYSSIPALDYFERNCESVKEMHRQVGDLKLDGGIAYRGLLIRHLVLPNDIAGSQKILEFVAKVSKNSYINIMDQYRPAGDAWKFKELCRGITPSEYNKAVEYARELGLHRGF